VAKPSAKTKFIFITGGVVSGLGKGITSASIGNILKARGFRVSMQKCDPYLNTDSGTLNPAEHGEVFVTHDGAETDLDLGHYERFIDIQLDQRSSLMSGRVLASVIENERAGKYLGKTVQIIPHVTAEIQDRLIEAGEGSDVHLVEIGGTVGDYESMAFAEAIRQMKRRLGAENILYVHLVYVPYLKTSKELKTKPAQNSVRDLREVGIQPDVLCVRSDHELSESAIEKLSLYCDVDARAVVPLMTLPTVYTVPLVMEEYGLGDYITERLFLPKKTPNFTNWQALVRKIEAPKPTVTVGIVAKYLANEDTYTSVVEAVKAAGWHHGVDAKISWIDAEKIEEASGSQPDTKGAEQLRAVDGLIVPGGFGSRGTEGKIKAAQYARLEEVPYLGLCLGLHIAVIEFARNVAGLRAANSIELDPKTPHPVIDLMPDQRDVKLGGSMRLGDYPTRLGRKTHSYTAYGSDNITERHRHRYEFNNTYREQLRKAGLVIAGTSPNRRLVEIIELPNHPFFVASQFHPEFLSRPNRPHPLFRDFIGAVVRSKVDTLSDTNQKAAITAT